MRKNIKYIFIVSMFCSVLAGCSKLDETVYSSIYTNQFYKTGADAEAGITSVYGSLASLYQAPAPLMVEMCSSDQLFPRSVVGRNSLAMYIYDAAYSQQVSVGRPAESPYWIWQYCYAGLEKANNVIENAGNAVMDEKRKAEILGEAYFMRAFFHWTLSKNFGDVVVKIKASKSLADATNPKSLKADVYKQIFSDLDLAVTNLPNYSSGLIKGRASKQAALALYAKSALYAENYAVALAKANLVIASGLHSLMPKIKDAFDVTKEDAARVENIFAFEQEGFASPSKSSMISNLLAPLDAIEYSKNAYYRGFYAYASFFASFSPLDARRTLLDTTYVNSKGLIIKQKEIDPTVTKSIVLVKKYQDPVSAFNTACNIRLLSYPDVLLIAAEAEARLNGATATAYGFVNQIRARAGLSNLTPGLSKDSFIDAVIQERAWELFAEGDRWYDLTRTNKFLTVIPLAVNDVYPVRTPLSKHRYFPIPMDEINANPAIKQNPEW